MSHPAIPQRRREAAAPAVLTSAEAALTEAADVRRAEDVQPRGYNARTVTEPPAELVAAADSLEAVALAADLIRMPVADREQNRRIAALISLESRRLAGVLRSLAAGAALVALLAAGLVVAPTGGTTAQAAEIPQADPAPSATVRVVLGTAPVRVHAIAYTPNASGYYCPSVWNARGPLGRACGLSPVVTVTIDTRTVPVGRSLAQVVDDASDVATSTIVLDARRASRFGVGSYLDMGRGDMLAAVPVTMFSPAAGRYVPQNAAPVKIQELTLLQGWVTRATLYTNAQGVATGIVHFGGGLRSFRAVRPAGRTVWGTTGTRRSIALTTEPLDIM